MKTVVFCSHKGGAGKTCLLSHVVSQYATSHPDRKVLLVDCSVSADVTRQVLGGDHDFKGEDSFDKVTEAYVVSVFCLLKSQSLQISLAACLLQVLELQPRRTSTALFERCAAATPSEARAETTSRSWFGRKAATEPEASAGPTVDIESYIVRIADYNLAVPDNVYLCGGGPGKAEMVSFSKEQQRAASQALQQSLTALQSFDVFIDTDGDLSFSDYTRIALLGRSGLIIVPSEASFLDYNRILSFLDVSP